MKDSDFIGKRVVSLADGAQVGTVKDLVFHELELTALVIRGERGEGLLPFADLGKNGPDAITIESFTLVDWNAGHALQPDGRTTRELRELSVFDANGKKLGHIHDFTMDVSGHVEDFAVRSGGVLGIGADERVIDGSQVLALGEDLITVKASPKPTPKA
ncbi:MAG TPA: PRC-barrel domain-containing protein [Fimbriimonadaceae bacterium]|nr:PRC-barrel domain-containing protein [Fimbriimonadaceae bacterium]